MIPGSEAVNTYEYDDRYVIQPAYRYFERGEVLCNGKIVPHDFEYASDKNGERIVEDELRRLAGIAENEG